MNLNPDTVPERLFKKPMHWATLEQLECMRDEAASELSELHYSVRGLAAQRNGFKALNTEIRNRLR